jgi:hypothetical protein
VGRWRGGETGDGEGQTEEEYLAFALELLSVFL